jgi:hypothetical protein
MMAGMRVIKSKGPYSYVAEQNPDSTWTVKVSRVTGRAGKSQAETHVYTSAKQPSSPATAWRTAGGSLARTTTTTGIRIILTAAGIVIIFLILIAILLAVV